MKNYLKRLGNILLATFSITGVCILILNIIVTLFLYNIPINSPLNKLIEKNEILNITAFDVVNEVKMFSTAALWLIFYIFIIILILEYVLNDYIKSKTLKYIVIIITGIIFLLIQSNYIFDLTIPILLGISLFIKLVVDMLFIKKIKGKKLFIRFVIYTVLFANLLFTMEIFDDIIDSIKTEHTIFPSAYGYNHEFGEFIIYLLIIGAVIYICYYIYNRLITNKLNKSLKNEIDR